MNTETIFSEIQKLSVAQQILLLEKAWDNISNSTDEIAVPGWQKKILDERLEEHKANPNENNLSARDVFSQLRQPQ